MKLASFFLPSLAPLILAAAVRAADADAWKSRTIYFALTDRIARSADDTGGDACSDLSNYCGGTFQGLESKLDYIQGMGFDAIWITPVVANKDGGYHGYWASDLYSVNEKYGTADDLKSLVSAAHDKGIFVMVDVVANHMGSGDVASNKPDALSRNSSYHAWCDINYDDQTSVEQCWVAGNLPDVNTEDPEVVTLYQKWIGWLVGEYGFDGVRIDTVKHVSRDFWPGFSDAAGVFTIGEVFDGDPQVLAGYTGSVGGLLNYAVYYPMRAFFQQSESGSAQAIVDAHDALDRLVPDSAAFGTFLDNHDNARWLSSNGDTALLRNALAYVVLARGIPIVYYGTEQGFAGGDDPANREDLWRSGFDTSKDLYGALANLTAARAAAGGLRAGDDHVHLLVENGAYAWSRAGGDVVVLTTNGGGASGDQQHCFGTKRPGGSWRNIFTGRSNVTADGSGQLCLNVSNGEPVVLLGGNASQAFRHT